MKTWKEFSFVVNGFPVQARYTEENIKEIFVPMVRRLDRMQREKGERLVVFLDRWLPLVPFVCYPVLLCLLNIRLSRLFLTQKQAALDFMVLIARSVFVPGLVFWGGTLLRTRLHFPRPYEQSGFTPLVAKESRGHSMPSRHALSAAVLAAVWLYFYPAAGCVMVGIALLICCLRVLTGVHHVRDVVCGFALGFALGCAGMWLL